MRLPCPIVRVPICDMRCFRAQLSICSAIDSAGCRWFWWRLHQWRQYCHIHDAYGSIDGYRRCRTLYIRDEMASQDSVVPRRARRSSISLWLRLNR